jgi:hypothetical protein
VHHCRILTSRSHPSTERQESQDSTAEEHEARRETYRVLVNPEQRYSDKGAFSTVNKNMQGESCHRLELTITA